MKLKNAVYGVYGVYSAIFRCSFYTPLHSTYTADVQVLCKTFTVYRQLHTIHSIHTDFEIHFRFFLRQKK